MKTVLWRLSAGKMEGQETAEQKRQFGYDYVAKLAEEEKIINVVDDGNYLNIYIDDTSGSE